MMLPRWLLVLIVLMAIYQGIASYCRFKQALGLKNTCEHTRTQDLD